MARDLHDIEAVFAAFGMAGFPYRTFPPDAQRGAALPDRRRERPRADVRRPERAGPRGPLRRLAGDDVRVLAQPASPRL
ncbi:hypothetical protein [Lichenibacterium dinghuense]|uniref:hypothetical protein n=1 Tax=Lichenibacterium dinghuense TaxID=2895977 RepID=UPI001F1A6858|nr:hypothetical protein [Lichenibacterium sp. 6Y81]